MVIYIVQISIALCISVILFVMNYLGKKNPNMITGFKWGVSAQEIAEDKRWLKSFSQWLKWDAALTFILGVAAAFIHSVTFYNLSLVVPTVVVVCYLSITMPKGGRRM